MRNDPLHARQYDAEIYHLHQRDAGRIFPCIPEIFLDSNLGSRHTDGAQRQLAEETEYKSEQYGEGVLHDWLAVGSWQLAVGSWQLAVGGLALSLSLNLGLKPSPISYSHVLQ